MKSLSKVRRIATLVAVLSSRTPANRIANWGFVLAIGFLIGCEEHARRTWRDRAVESEDNLNQVRQFLALERAHVKKLCAVAELVDILDDVAITKLSKEAK